MTPPRCHPDRPHAGRRLCKPCYDHHLWTGTLHQHPPVKPQRSRSDFVADYRLLRSDGYSHAQIADRLGMRYNTLLAARRRAVRAGDLTPDRRPA